MNDSQPDILREVAASLGRYHRFLVATHVRPDGDAIGSLLSMTRMLAQLGKEATPCCQDPAPAAYQFLQGTHLIGQQVVQPSRYQAAVLVDCGDFHRVGEALAESIAEIPFLVSIDHHVARVPFGNLFWSNTSASSTCEMLYDLCGELACPIDATLAECLYTGLLADSGSFRFSNTNQRVLEIAAKLVAAGADPAFIAEEVYNSGTVGSLRLLAMVLATVGFYAGDRLATAELNRKMFSETSTSPADTEGLINFLRSVKTVSMAMLFREGVDGRVHVSLRSKGDVDVSAFARKRGGGGHRHAAAFELPGTLPETRSRLTGEALAYIEQAQWNR